MKSSVVSECCAGVSGVTGSRKFLNGIKLYHNSMQVNPNLNSIIYFFSRISFILGFDMLTHCPGGYFGVFLHLILVKVIVL